MRTHLLAQALLLGTAGCFAPSEQSGIRIGDATLEQFKPGKTSENWVLAILGEPSSTAQVQGEDDVRVLRYSLVQEHGGMMGGLFGGSSITVSTVYFIVRKGVVESLWADRAEAPGLFGGGEESGEKKD
jgi:hypothetical protein